ncbi:MAG: alpha/beta hydrolase [Planctomycetes bacterium]|nr:alpha/beta hydrolase [Planctomycetota bacterium]MCH9725682.1 alpha/beta hydrolase [Planctomycetota bacterium]MCH9777736.1 alpha/beta hydrolase [Planctomycetota bacterium]MCH9790934.1 alpha/beta hydrolase [Planctomycetota bacterium]MDF1744508.1 alpha/beta hydrolase [Gimesia sp.]
MNSEPKSTWNRLLPWLVPMPGGMFGKPQNGKQMLVYYFSRVLAFYVLTMILLMLVQRWLIYQPTQVDTLSLDLANTPYGVVHEISTKTEDGLELKGWHFIAGQIACLDHESCNVELAKGRPVVILLHGNGGNRLHRLETCRLLASLNLHVFAFDYRGYAENPGSPSQTGLLNDARAFWKYAVRNRKINPDRIILMGESLGGGVATLLASELCQQNTPPAGLVLRSTFSSMVDAASHHYPIVPVSWLLWDQYRSQSVISNIVCPLLLIHGTEDQVVPYELGKKLFEAAPATSASGVPKEMLTIEKGTHNGLIYEARGPLTIAYDQFAKQVIAQSIAQPAVN